MKNKYFFVLLAVLSLSATLVTAGCGSKAEGASSPSHSFKKTIGIIAAMDCEVDILKDNLDDIQIYEIAGSEYYSGTIGNHEVICVKCGIGKVSAALGTQALISHYDPDLVINTGCAGALSHDLDVGDMVLAEETVEWDMDNTPLGDPRGYITALDKVKMTADKETTDEIATVIDDDSTVFRGLIATGDQFVSSKEQRNTILDAFPEALCAEMEGSAIGHVCEQNGVPFCVIRCMSDNADGDSGVDFEVFAQKAGKKSAAALLEYLRMY